jgi:ABC-type glycerol-3-phosphate transport system substrate-binding protein
VRRGLAALCVALACLGVVGCSDDADAPADQGSDATAATRPVSGSLVVLAEPDLEATMSAVVPEFQDANPGATVTVEPMAAADIVAKVDAGEGDVVAMAAGEAVDELEGTGKIAAVVPLSDAADGPRAAAVVASANPAAATRFVSLAAG